MEIQKKKTAQKITFEACQTLSRGAILLQTENSRRVRMVSADFCFNVRNLRYRAENHQIQALHHQLTGRVYQLPEVKKSWLIIIVIDLFSS